MKLLGIMAINMKTPYEDNSKKKRKIKKSTLKEDNQEEVISYSSKNLTHKDEDEDCLLTTESLSR